ncbi:RluA family pseudouridine synthase [Bacillus solitudinis]|uniref:RluA family pseudouridine synthase n=1 Tax=Bacillus solitudinis TaxID=2014074 RepID=UPI001D0D40EE|nr:RluA family pseudouridine synthase [Bacillus solitudinis]
MANYVSLQWEIKKDNQGQLLRSFLREEQKISKKALAEIKFSDGKIMVNNLEATVRTVLKTGDIVRIQLPPEVPSGSIAPEQIDLLIEFEDEHLMVIHKPANMATIPSREHRTGTLANAVIGYYLNKGIPATFHAVNRLDKDTSGLLVIAKHRLAHDRLSKLQQQGRLHRYYTAIVEGELTKGGTIIAPIGRKRDSIIEREVRMDGKHAITHFDIKKHTKEWTLVKIKLETGRTHQIRVHFAYLGYPLCGDELYGGRRDKIARQALHCHQVDFIHPFSGKAFSLRTELPTDFKTTMSMASQGDV